MQISTQKENELPPAVKNECGNQAQKVLQLRPRLEQLERLQNAGNNGN